MNDVKEIEKSIIKKFRSKIYKKFIHAVKDFELIKENDKICCCISGGKDSFLLAKCMQELQIHSKYHFELKYIVMDPGYKKENLDKIKTNLKLLGIDAVIYKSDIFKEIESTSSPCYLCARKRRGSLYAKAEELGCNKIALGHHFDDAIETIMLNILYAGEYKAMMPKLKSKNFKNMELIRPLYYIKEEDIISWARYNNLNFLDCACNVTKKSLGKRLEMKNLIKNLRKINKNVDINILNSSKNINIDAVLGYKSKNLKYNFLDDYEERNIFDE